MNISNELYQLWTSPSEQEKNLLKEIGTPFTGITTYHTSFIDGDGNAQELEITKKVYLAIGLGNRKLRNIQRSDERNYEHSELTEISLHQRAMHPPKTVEEIVYGNIQNEQLHKAIENLPDIQKRRLLLYYFEGMTYEEISILEKFSFQTIGRTIKAAEKRIKNNLI